MRVVTIAMACLIFFACGENDRDGQDGTTLETTDLPVGSPQCPAGGIMVTIDGAPRALCNGEDGQDGAPGATGAAGPAGMAGTPGKDGEASGYRPTLIMSCNKAVDFYTGGDGIAESFFAYDAVVYSNGDAEVSCVAAGGDQSGSDRRYFARGTVGADKLGCVGGLDYPPNDAVSGFVDFSIGAQGPTATYHDSPNPMNGDYYVFGGADCVVRKWNGAAWAIGSLADL